MPTEIVVSEKLEKGSSSELGKYEAPHYEAPNYEAPHYEAPRLILG